MSKNSVGNVSMDLTLNKGNFNRMIKSAAGEGQFLYRPVSILNAIIVKIIPIKIFPTTGMTSFLENIDKTNPITR